MRIEVAKNHYYYLRLWFLLEMFIRIIIAVVCIFVLQDNVDDFRIVRWIGYIFMIWCLRPAYLSISGLIREIIFHRYQKKKLFALQNQDALVSEEDQQ